MGEGRATAFKGHKAGAASPADASAGHSGAVPGVRRGRELFKDIGKRPNPSRPQQCPTSQAWQFSVFIFMQLGDGTA